MTTRRSRKSRVEETSISLVPSTSDNDEPVLSSSSGPQPPLRVEPPSHLKRRAHRLHNGHADVSSLIAGTQPLPRQLQELEVTSHTLKRNRQGDLEQDTSTNLLKLDAAAAKRIRWETSAPTSEPLPDLFSSLSLSGQETDPEYLAWSDFEVLPQPEPAPEPMKPKVL